MIIFIFNTLILFKLRFKKHKLDFLCKSCEIFCLFTFLGEEFTKLFLFYNLEKIFLKKYVIFITFFVDFGSFLCHF